jgi:PST family polysaccharide transporter
MVESSQDNSEPTDSATPGLVRQETRKVLVLQVLRQVVAVAGAATLYRLLGPESFGLYGMVIPLLMLPRMAATLGLSTAAVQTEQLSVSQRSAVFYITLAFGLLAALMTGALGHVFGRIYEVPALVWISWIFAGTTLVDSLGLTHLAGIQRQLRLGRVAAIRLVSQLVAVVAAIMVARRSEFGVAETGIVALITLEYCQLTVNTLGYWISGSWCPGRLVKAELKQLLAFGGNYSLSSLVFYAGQNLDKVLLALVLGSTQTGQRLLGMYTAMYNLMMKPVYFVTDPVTSVMLPSLSRARKNLPDYHRIARDFYRFTAILLIPAGVGLAVVSHDVALLISGPHWDEAASMLLALAPAICVHGMINISGSLLASVGQTGRLLAAALILLLVQIQGYAAAYWFSTQFDLGAGITQHHAFCMTVGAAYSFVLFLAAPHYLTFCFSRVGLSVGPLLIEFAQILGRAMLMGVTVWFVQDLLLANDIALILRLPLAILVGVAAYCLLMWSRITESVIPFLMSRQSERLS